MIAISLVLNNSNPIIRRMAKFIYVVKNLINGNLLLANVTNYDCGCHN